MGQRRHVVRATVIVWDKAMGDDGYGLHAEYDDGTSAGVLVGTQEEAFKAAQEVVKRGEEFIKELVRRQGDSPSRPYGATNA